MLTRDDVLGELRTCHTPVCLTALKLRLEIKPTDEWSEELLKHELAKLVEGNLVTWQLRGADKVYTLVKVKAPPAVEQKSLF